MNYTVYRLNVAHHEDAMRPAGILGETNSLKLAKRMQRLAAAQHLADSLENEVRHLQAKQATFVKGQIILEVEGKAVAKIVIGKM